MNLLRRLRAKGGALPLCALLLLSPGCDWEHFALMNSIPVTGDPANNPEVRVYLGVDGLTPLVVERARAQGAFAAEDAWTLSRMAVMFPATSDASWTRLLRAPRLQGYEYGHYDPEQDQLINKGIGGLLAHVVPPFEGSPLGAPGDDEVPAYYRGFDQHAAAYLDAAVSYGYPILTLHQSMDAIFATLEGRSETNASFSAYVLQVDVIGHSLGEDAMLDAVIALDDKIRNFVRRHPERRFYFTLFSDHGVDFVQKPADKVIDFREDLKAAGVFPAESFAQGRAQSQPWAVPVLHTRVTYVTLHTTPEQVDEVARRGSAQPSVDLILARANAPADAPPGVTQWLALWGEGQRQLLFGYAPSRDRYCLPRTFDRARLGVALGAPPPGEGSWVEYDDEALFAATIDGEYPDLFYRSRTALEPIGVRFPGDLIVSLRHPYVSAGFELPGSAETATAGSHGALERRGSLGTLLTNERTLPAAVRGDTLLDFFPTLREHMQRRGLDVGAQIPGASLQRR